MADMRTIATAVESYLTDHPDWKPARLEDSPVRLAALLQPKYIRQIPANDGWGRPFGLSIGTSEQANEVAVDYTIWSTGRDGKRDPKWNGAVTNFDNDLVYSNGNFIQYPEGT